MSNFVHFVYIYAMICAMPLVDVLTCASPCFYPITCLVCASLTLISFEMRLMFLVAWSCFMFTFYIFTSSCNSSMPNQFSSHKLSFRVVLSSITKKGEIERASRPLNLFWWLMTTWSMRLTCVLQRQLKVSALMGIHGYLGPWLNGFHVLVQRISAKIKEKLVLSVMDVEDT